MTGKIKLNAASGGGTVSLQAPSSSGNDRIITLPTSADGTVLTTTNPKAGNIIQVVNVEKTDVASTSSTSFSDISGMSASITPSSSSSKILVTVFLGQFSCEDAIYLTLCLADGTNLLGGDSVSGAETSSTGAYSGGNSTGEAYYGANPATLVKLHSPNTTSSVTYKIRWRVNVGTGYFNRNSSDTNQYKIRCASTITLMEVAA